MTNIRPFPGGKIPRQRRVDGCRKIKLTQEQEQWLRDYFPTTCGKTLREKMGVCLSTFYRILRDLGIHKTQAVRARIWRHNSKRGQETCRENGYYDSLRGRAPSPQSVEGTREYWRSVRRGERLHPLRKLRKEHPVLYRKFCDGQRKKRIRLIKSERLRLMSGMRQESRLSVRIVPYTKSQTSHRYNAVRRGYWYYKDCADNDPERWNIYYDGDTRRAPRFEENLRKDGFKVLDGTNL